MKKIFFLLLVCVSTKLSAQEDNKSIDYQKFRLAFNTGYSIRLAKVANSVSQLNRPFIQDLKSGINYGVDLSYIIGKDWGIGLKVNQFRASTNRNYYDEFRSVMFAGGKTSTTFFGPSYYNFYNTKNDKHSFHSNISLGVLKYNQTTESLGVEMKGATFGFDLDFSYDYHLTKQISIGAQVNYVVGNINEMTMSSNSQSQKIDLGDEKENLGRLDFSLGARFRF